MTDNVPNIVSGRVTRHANNSQRRTPSWLKAVYAVIFGLVAIIALALTLAPSPDNSPAGHVLPTCAEEDGSGASQKLPCYWDASEQGNGEGADVINFRDGTWKTAP